MLFFLQLKVSLFAATPNQLIRWLRHYWSTHDQYQCGLGMLCGRAATIVNLAYRFPCHLRYINFAMSSIDAGKKAAAYRAVDEWLKVIFFFI